MTESAQAVLRGDGGVAVAPVVRRFYGAWLDKAIAADADRLCRAVADFTGWSKQRERMRSQ